MKRLTPASLTLIMLFVVGGLVVAYVAKGLLAVEEKPVAANRNIPMPVADIPPGTVITESHIGLGPIRISELKPDMLLNNRVIVGRVVKETLKAATPIRAPQLYEPGARPPLEIEDGLRAVTIDIGGAAGIVDGLIKPGQFCDIHMTVSDYQGDDTRINPGLTLTLFKGVRILAINRFTQQGTVSRDSNSVTLELTPAQANVILLAQGRGNLSLTYNPAGKGTGTIAVSNADRVLLDEILGIPQKVTVPPPFTSHIYRRSALQELQFREVDGRKLMIDTPLGGAVTVPGAVGVPPGASSATPVPQEPAAPAAAPDSPTASVSDQLLMDSIRRIYTRRYSPTL